MERRSLVVGYTWADGGVRLKVWEQHQFVQVDLRGRLSFRLEPGRWCTGLHDGEVLVECPDRAPSTRGTACDACGARDAFRPCMTCDGFRCPRLSAEMSAWCRQRHHLYLACFGDEEIKVGTASDPRKDQRVVEQGPLAAARVASAEGPLVKQMEAKLVAAGFSETMRRSRKTALLRGAMTEAAARALVEVAASRLRGDLSPEYHPYLHEPVFVPQPELAVRSRSLALHELELQEGRVVEGEVVGAVGHVLFVRDPDGTFALDLGRLKGRRITWDPAGPKRRSTAQLGLF